MIIWHYLVDLAPKEAGMIAAMDMAVENIQASDLPNIIELGLLTTEQTSLLSLAIDASIRSEPDSEVQSRKDEIQQARGEQNSRDLDFEK